MLQHVLLSISQQAEHDLEHLPHGDLHTHVHALRVRVKKLRAVLRLIKGGLARQTDKAIRHHLRVIKQAFANSRDQHVLHELMADPGKGGAPRPKDVLHDRHHLDDSRKLGSLLGELHDLVLLREGLKKSAPRGLVRTARRRARHLRGRAFRTARRLFDLPPQKIARQVKARLLKWTVPDPPSRAQKTAKRRHRRRGL